MLIVVEDNRDAHEALRAVISWYTRNEAASDENMHGVDHLREARELLER